VSTIVLDLESDRVLAAEVSVAKGRARVVRALACDVPESLEPGAEPLGAWIRERLDEAGMTGKSAVVAATRAEVLVKRIEAPTDSLGPAERHQMVHLQMSKQASLAAGSSVVDYVEGEPGGDADDGSTFVIASAMPAERVEQRRETVKAAGLKLNGIRLRTAGVRALVSEELDDDRPTLLVNPSVGSVELLMLVGGQVVSSRSVAIGLPGPMESGSQAAGVYAERVAVEASRTLVSFRVMEHGGEIERAVALAGGALGTALEQALGERLGLPAQTLDPATLVEFAESIEPRLHPAFAPLAGLMLCAPRGLRAHDFANPTTPPDTRAALRQGLMAALLALVVLGGIGFVLGKRAIADAERARTKAESALGDAADDFYETYLNGARLGHISAFTDDSMDWPAHLETIVGLLPDAESAMLGEINVRLESTPRFVSGKQLKDQEAWVASPVMSVSIGGVARDRAHIAALRQRLLDSGLYTVSSQGPEVENRFSLQIATAATSPAPEVGSSDDKENGTPGEAEGEGAG
jgi:Tfp pilus assembly PilM family ATPase